MTSLPSFVELMASLGLDQSTKIPDHQPQSTHSSPSTSPRLIGAGIPMRSRSKSTQSSKEASRLRTARYSPYSPVVPCSRRDSLSSVSSCLLERDQSPVRAISSSPKAASPRYFSRRSANNLSINVYGSASDLAVSTPISSYVRRKTPGASPTSPTFSHDSPPISPVPMTVPTLPAFWPNSSSGSLSIATQDIESPTFETYSPSEVAKTHRCGRRSVGTRISTPHSADLTSHHPRRRSLAPVC